MPQIAHYGWIPDLPDQRDYQYAAPIAAIGTLPTNIDLTSACPPVYDQEQLGSCTANAIAGAIQFEQMKQNLAQIRDGMKSVGLLGDCPEDMWPYIIANFAEKPSDACYQTALQHKAILYQRVVRDLIQMKGCLASGYPFVFGFTVYESFETQQVAQTGHAPMPQHREKMLGGHAVMAVGYDDANQRFIVRNSWGTSWGMQGYFTLPYAYFTSRNLSSDFWTVRLVQ